MSAAASPRTPRPMRNRAINRSSSMDLPKQFAAESEEALQPSVIVAAAMKGSRKWRSEVERLGDGVEE